jgi:23S rRNA (pseudouridine1915-N3)-methyltransferase
MRTLLLAVGKLRPAFREACDEYLTRIRRYGPIDEREVREAGRASTPALRRREESARLAGAIPQGARVVLLDREGSPWNSEGLAEQVDRWRASGSLTTLVIGGAWGLEPAGFGSGIIRWSLGPLTFPHELARVIVLEQWYRAWTILRREAYHK